MKKIISFLALFLFILSVMVQPSCHGIKDNDKKMDSIVSPYMDDPLIKSLTEKIHQSPKDGEPYAKRARAFFDMQKIMPAYADINRAIQLDPKNVSYYFLEGDISLASGNSEGAIKSFQQIIEMQPGNTEAITKLARTYFYKKDYDNCMEQVKRLIALDKTNFEPYFIMGLAYKEKGDTIKAIKSFQDVLQYRQDFYDAYMQLGLLTSNRNTKEAPQYFDNAIRLDSTQADPWYDKGKFYQDHGQYEQAKAIYRHLIKMSPHSENAFFNTGFIYILQDSLNKAWKSFDYAIKVKPSYAAAYYYRGLCDSQLGRKEDAKADLRQCLTLDPKNELAESLLNTLNKK